MVFHRTGSSDLRIASTNFDDSGIEYWDRCGETYRHEESVEGEMVLLSTAANRFPMKRHRRYLPSLSFEMLDFAPAQPAELRARKLHRTVRSLMLLSPLNTDSGQDPESRRIGLIRGPNYLARLVASAARWILPEF